MKKSDPHVKAKRYEIKNVILWHTKQGNINGRLSLMALAGTVPYTCANTIGKVCGVGGDVDRKEQT